MNSIMIKLFKSTTALYVTSIISGIFLLASLTGIGVYDNGEKVRTISESYIPDQMFPLLLVLWFLICFFVSYIDAARKMNKILNIMFMDCNLTEYLRVYKKFFEKKLLTRLGQYHALNLSTGYLSIGDNENAWEMLSKITYFANNLSGAINKVCYYSNLFVYYSSVNDVQNAAKCLEEMKAALDNKKLPKARRSEYYILYKINQFSLNMANGNYDGCEKIFNAVFERDKLTLHKVFAKYTLGKVYMHDNRMEEAKEAFGYAASNGGDSIYAVKSKEFLSQIEKEPYEQSNQS